MEEARVDMLNKYYKQVHAILLCHQSHTLGLFPRGKSGHARVRDNVYCASALWSLSLAYRHIGDDKGRMHELEQSAVKCMRGILFCYMRQAEKVEHFKWSQSWADALHSRFNTHTGDPVVKNEEWGHLQIDGTSFFLLMLAQMTASDLQVIFTMDEVDFVQNLVYYVERAYRTPDYGMWERGSRDNVGRRELHASSIGMAKAALEAINGLNLFGSQGSSLSIIHVDPDAHYRNCVILNNLLPRESSSKETDASLLFIVGYPAFAIDDATICQQTKERTEQLLGSGRKHGTTYGFKRFTRDGHHTVKEDPSKKYYNPQELTQYEGIECEWPLFFIIIILSEFCHGNKEEAEKYWEKLNKCLVLQHGTTPDMEDWMLVPRLYYVSESEIVDGTPTRGSVILDKEVKMEPMEEDIPFLWAQALYLIARLTQDGLLTVNDLDPLGLHLPHHARNTGMARHLGFKAPGHDTIIQVALISETTRLQAILATHGIPTQTQKQVEPIKIRPPGDILMKVFQNIGANKKLGLTGRPNRPIGALGTSKVYRILGQMVVFFPTDFNVDFYISFDVMMLIDLFTSTMAFLNLYWNMSGKPTICIYLTENRLKGNNFRKFIDFLAQVKHGVVNGIKVRLNSLQALISTSYVENLEVSMDEETDKSLQKRLHNPPRRSQSGTALFSTSSSVSLGSRSVGDDYDVFMVDDTEIQLLSETDPQVEVEPEFSQADLKNWSTDKLLETLVEVTHSNQLGRLYIIHELRKRNEQQRIDTDEMLEETLQGIYEDTGEKKHWKTVRLAAAMLRKIVDSLAPSLTSLLVRGKEVSLGVFGCPEVVISEPMSPKEIVEVIYEKCMPYDPVESVLQQELLIYLGEYITRQYHAAFNGMIRIRLGWIIQAMKNENSRIAYGGNRTLHQLAPSEIKELLLRVLLEDDTRKPLNQRQLDGALNRVPADFYVKVFGILQRVHGGIFVRDKQLPQVPTIYEMGAHEKGFALKVEELLSSISFPEYRQMIVELLMVISTVLERNPEVNIKGSINLDELLQDAMHLHSEDKSHQKPNSKEQTDSRVDAGDENSTSYACYKSDSFYTLFPDGPCGSVSYIARAVVNKVLQEGLQYDPSKSCSIS